MATPAALDSTKTAPKKAATPVYGKISPFDIFGFPDVRQKKVKPVLTDHPSFPNPRNAENMDQGVIAEVKEAGRLLDPVRLREVKSADGSIVYALIDGKTRLTGVAQDLKENPDSGAWEKIEYLLVKGTDDEAYVYMGQLNFEESRKPLTDIEVAKFLVSLDARGISEEVQAEMLNKQGRGGIRWIRDNKRVAQSATLTEAVESGEIPIETARAIARETQDEDTQDDIVDAVAEEPTDAPQDENAVAPDPATTKPKAQKKTAAEKAADKAAAEKQKVAEAKKATRAAKDAGKSDADAQREGRKAVTGKSGNKTTLGYDETMATLKHIYPEAKKAIKIVRDPEFEAGTLKWDDADVRAEFITQVKLNSQYGVLVKMLKLSGSLYDQFAAIEAEMTDEEMEAVISWMPEVTKAAKPADATAA